MKKIIAATGIGAALAVGSLTGISPANAQAPRWGQDSRVDSTFINGTCSMLTASQGHITPQLVLNMVNQGLTVFGGDYLEQGYPAAEKACPMNKKALDYAIGLLR